MAMTKAADAVESVFLAALERACASERLAYVEGACAGMPELLAQVRELLRCHETGGPLDRRPPGVGLEVGPSGGSEVVGTVIGPYKLLEQIGEGGMGLVFMAEQSAPVRRKVALKIIKP